MSQHRSWSGRHELHVGSLIGTRWFDGAGDLAQRANPADEQPLSSAHLITATEMQDAIATAERARAGWAKTPFHDRAEVLVRASDAFLARDAELAELLTLEQGKPLAEALAEVRRSAHILRFFASEADRESGDVFNSPRIDEHIRVVHRPRGVIALITPWNFPVAIPIWKLAPALVYGNTVVWKPAGIVPALSAVMARILVEAGLPEGVLNLTHCAPAVAQELVTSPVVGAISFTGSTAVGTHIITAAAATRTPVQAEMGGKNVTIVMADADLDLVTDSLVEGSMGSSGQRCTASERLLVDVRIAEELLERIAARVDRLTVGDGLDPQTDIGPVATATAKKDIQAAFEAAVRGGARQLAASALEDRAGHFVAPTLFEIQDTTSPIWTDEVFGPVLAAKRFDTFGEALALANETPYGLSAAVFTDTHSVVERAAELNVGVLHINSATIGADPHVPFGGIAASGYGPKEQGGAARDFYTNSQTIYEKWVPKSE